MSTHHVTELRKKLLANGYTPLPNLDQSSVLKDWPRALLDLRSWVEGGEIKVREDVIDGLENLPAALIGLLAGENVGKRMVRVS